MSEKLDFLRVPHKPWSISVLSDFLMQTLLTECCVLCFFTITPSRFKAPASPLGCCSFLIYRPRFYCLCFRKSSPLFLVTPATADWRAKTLVLCVRQCMNESPMCCCVFSPVRVCKAITGQLDCRKHSGASQRGSLMSEVYFYPHLHSLSPRVI